MRPNDKENHAQTASETTHRSFTLTRQLPLPVALSFFLFIQLVVLVVVDFLV